MLETIQKPLNGVLHTMECRNPATGGYLGSIEMATAEQVRAAREHMRVAGKMWGRKSVGERVKALRKLQGVLIDAHEEITAVINKDTGKPRQDALVELFITVNMLSHSLNHARRWLGRSYQMPGLYLTKLAYIEQKPYGTVAVISPWNYPFVLALQPVLQALLAGNSVILKPSEVTAMTGALIERLLKRVPEIAPYVTVLHGDGRVGAALVETKPDLIYLTGSTRTGEVVAKAAAEHLIPTVFELGGKDPMIVLDSAEIDSAAKWGAWAATANAGQTCVAIERFYAVESIYDEFVKQMVSEAEKIKVGYSEEIKGEFNYGPLSSDRQAEIVADHLEDALSKGAVLHTGGNPEGLMMKPTVLTEVDESMKLMREETFGPLIPIIKVKDAEEAVRRANDSEFGLGASVWGSVGDATGVLDELEAGTLVVNDAIAQFAVPTLPFGGVKKSGNGRSHGKEDLLQFSQSVSYMVSTPPVPFDIAVKMREPGNYRLGETLLKVAFGTSLKQKSEPFVDLWRSRRVQDVVEGVQEKVDRATSSVEERVREARNR